jgi:hypothetical protein
MIDALVNGIKTEWRETVRAMKGESPTLAQQDEATLIRRAAEGERVRAFLESEPVVDFMSRQEAQLVDALTALPLEDDAGRKNLAVAIQTVRQLRKFLLAAAQDGRMAERELDRLRSGKRAFF